MNESPEGIQLYVSYIAYRHFNVLKMYSYDLIVFENSVVLDDCKCKNSIK